jgi:hypothetical protein
MFNYRFNPGSLSQHLKTKQTVAVRLVETGFILVNGAYKSRDDIVLQRINPFLSLALSFNTENAMTGDPYFARIIAESGH